MNFKLLILCTYKFLDTRDKLFRVSESAETCFLTRLLFSGIHRAHSTEKVQGVCCYSCIDCISIQYMLNKTQNTNVSEFKFASIGHISREEKCLR